MKTEARSQSYVEEEESDAEICCGCKGTLKLFIKYVVFRSLGLAFYCLDVYTDVNAGYQDYLAGDTRFAAFTFLFVFAPGIVFGLYMFCTTIALYAGELVCLKAPLWLLSVPVLPLWPVARDMKQILRGFVATLVPSKREKMLKKLNQPSRAYLLKFLEAFAEAAPQLLIRLFKVAIRSDAPFADFRQDELVQMSVSLISLTAKIITTYQKNVTTKKIVNGEVESEHRFRLPLLVQLTAFLWWLPFLLARFQALALFVSVFRWWLALLLGTHVALVFLFQTMASPKTFFSRAFVYFFNAFVFIFAYINFNIKSRLKVAPWFPYAVFSTLVFVENTIMLTVWFTNQHSALSVRTERDFLYPGNNYNFRYRSFNDTYDPLTLPTEQGPASDLSQPTHLATLSSDVSGVIHLSRHSAKYNKSEKQNKIEEDNASELLTQKFAENVTYLPSVTKTTMADLNHSNVTDSDNAADLVIYWEKLLYIHYGCYGTSVLFMILCFFCNAMRRTPDQPAQPCREENELESMTGATKSTVLV